MKKKIVQREEIWEQPEDCCGRFGENFQTITVKSQDGGGGSYIVIETARWAIDPGDIDTFTQWLKDFLTNVDSTFE